MIRVRSTNCPVHFWAALAAFGFCLAAVFGCDRGVEGEWVLSRLPGSPQERFVLTLSRDRTFLIMPFSLTGTWATKGDYVTLMPSAKNTFFEVLEYGQAFRDDKPHPIHLKRKDDSLEWSALGKNARFTRR